MLRRKNIKSHTKCQILALTWPFKSHMSLSLILQMKKQAQREKWLTPEPMLLTSFMWFISDNV